MEYFSRTKLELGNSKIRMAAFSMLRATKFVCEDFVVDRSVRPEKIIFDTVHIAVSLKLHCHPLMSIKLFHFFLV